MKGQAASPDGECVQGMFQKVDRVGSQHVVDPGSNGTGDHDTKKEVIDPSGILAFASRFVGAG